MSAMLLTIVVNVSDNCQKHYGHASEHHLSGLRAAMNPTSYSL